VQHLGLMQPQPVEIDQVDVGAEPRLQPAAILQHLQVLEDRREADRERLGQFAHAGFAGGEPRKDGAPGRVGEGPEGGAKLIGHCSLTDWLNN